MKVEVVDQRDQGRGVVGVRVPGRLHGFVGAAKTRKVRRDAAKAGIDEWRDNLPPEIRPGRLTVQQQHHRSLAHIDVGESHPLPLTEYRPVRKVDDAVEALGRRSEEPRRKHPPLVASRAQAPISYRLPGSRSRPFITCQSAATALSALRRSNGARSLPSFRTRISPW